jgi:hypothetical protein
MLLSLNPSHYFWVSQLIAFHKISPSILYYFLGAYIFHLLNYVRNITTFGVKNVRWTWQINFICTLRVYYLRLYAEHTGVVETLSICVQMVALLNICRITTYAEWVAGFPQSREAISGIVPTNRSRPSDSLFTFLIMLPLYSTLYGRWSSNFVVKWPKIKRSSLLIFCFCFHVTVLSVPCRPYGLSLSSKLAVFVLLISFINKRFALSL